MATPHEKQVMMYSATLDKEIRPVCRKFCQVGRGSQPCQPGESALLWLVVTVVKCTASLIVNRLANLHSETLWLSSFLVVGLLYIR